MVEELTAV